MDREGQGMFATDKQADISDPVLSQLDEFIPHLNSHTSTNTNNQPNNNPLTRQSSEVSSEFASDLAIGAEAIAAYSTPTTKRRISARKLHFDTTTSPTVHIEPKRSCLNEVNTNRAHTDEMLPSDRRYQQANNDTDSSTSCSNQDDARITQPFLHRYVDALNEIFARAEHRIDELKLMCIASAELDGFAIDMLNKTNKSSQFANIDNLSSIEAQHLLRAEMIRNEQNDQRIEMLTKRCVSLERRLAVCDTAEVFYSNLKHEMEDKLKKLLEEFGDVERRRIERCTKLLELNAKIERDYELKVTQNEALGTQLRSLNTTFASLKQDLHKSERNETSLRCELDSLRESYDSQQSENKELRDRIAQLERDSIKQRKSLRDAEEKLKEEMIKSERERKNAEMLEQQIGREKDIAQEKWNINEQKLTHLHQMELNAKCEEYENGTKRMEEMYERKVSKLRDEVMRVKHERDELVIKVCDYQHHNRTFKQQLIKNAQLKLADTCQKAVTEFAGTQFSSFDDSENIAPQFVVSALTSSRPQSDGRGSKVSCNNKPTLQTNLSNPKTTAISNRNKLLQKRKGATDGDVRSRTIENIHKN